jgi:hypothetical protein
MGASFSDIAAHKQMFLEEAMTLSDSAADTVLAKDRLVRVGRL